MKKLMTTVMALSMLAAVGFKNKTEEAPAVSDLQQKVDEYAEYTLTTDLSVLSEKEKALLPIFVQILSLIHI